jgi:hypothetical protein
MKQYHFVQVNDVWLGKQNQINLYSYEYASITL